MNEDGNTAVPQSPNFSSPNITSVPVDKPAAPQPTERVVTSADVAATAGTNAGAVAAALASMPEDISGPVAVSSGNMNVSTTAPTTPSISSAPVSAASSRFGGFASRRLRSGRNRTAADTVAAPSAPTFAGAPDFFNEAVAQQQGDIVLNNDGARRNRKPLIFAAIAAVVLIGGGIAVALLAGGKDGGIFGAFTQSAEQKLYNRLANYVIYGEDKEDALGQDKVDSSRTAIATMNAQGADAYLSQAQSIMRDIKEKTDDEDKKETIDQIGISFDELSSIWAMDNNRASLPYGNNYERGDVGAKSYISELFPRDEESGAKIANDVISAYYDAVIEKDNFMVKNGCFVANIIDCDDIYANELETYNQDISDAFMRVDVIRGNIINSIVSDVYILINEKVESEE